MASRRKEHQEDQKLKMFQILSSNPQITSRGLAQKVGISNGSAYNLLTSLIDKGFIKLSKFRKKPQKISYIYLLTLKGMHEKSILSHRLLIKKKKEHKLLEIEIRKLEQDTSLDI